MARKRSRNRKAKASANEPAPGAETPDEEPFCAGWIWWSASDAGRKPPKDDFDKKIPVHIRKEFHHLMRVYRDRVHELKHGLHYKGIGEGIFELRIKRNGNPYRLLFFRWGNYAVALDVFHKTTQKTPKEKALQRMATWIETNGPLPPQ